MDTSYETDIADLILQKNYPCIAAVQAFAKKDYQVRTYEGFGEGRSTGPLARDILAFRDEYNKTKTPYLSFFAVFEGPSEYSEQEFEDRLWKELSYLSSVEGLSKDWDPFFSRNPEDKNFCFSLDGTAFFVVGLHPNSSRKSHRFPKATLIFNVYEQFRELQKTDRYEPMVKQNRRRDVQFQGTSNPMAEMHGDDWESIQFSGKNNPPEWKCPFHHGLKPPVPS